MKEIMTIEDVQEFLDVSRQTVYNHIRRGYLKPKKVGGRLYFKKQDIMDLFD